MKIEASKSVERTVHGVRESASSLGQRAPSAGLFAASPASHLPPLQIGQELAAQVVELLVGGRLTLQIGEVLVEADNPGELHFGQRLRLRVEQIEPQLTLQIVDAEQSSGQAIEGQLTQLLRQRMALADESFFTGLGGLLKTLQAAAGGAAPSRRAKLALFLAHLSQSSAPWSAQQLQRFVRDGGLHFENKLLRAAVEPETLGKIADGDLKGLLLGLLDELAGEGRTSDGAAALADKLHDIEGQQAANLLAQAEGKALQLRVPLLVGAGMTDVAIAVESEAERSGANAGGKKGGYRMLFALDLEDFGPTRIDVQLHTDDLRAHFYVGAGESLARLRGALPALQTALHAAGYRAIVLAAQPLRELAAEQQEKFAALELGVPANVHLIDVKA